MSIGSGSSNSDTTGSTDQRTSGSSATQGSYSNGPVNAQQLIAALQSAQNLFQGGSPTINAGLDAVNSGAGAATGNLNAGAASLMKTLNGSYLDPATNPGFQTMVDRTIAATRPGIDASFEGAGRYGGGLAARAQGQGVADAVGALASGNYQQERQNQLGAAGLIPSYASAALQPGAAQLSAGYTPINQYIQQLGAISPGQTGQTAGNSNFAAVTQGTNSSRTSGSNLNIGAKVKG